MSDDVLPRRLFVMWSVTISTTRDEVRERREKGNEAGEGGGRVLSAAASTRMFLQHAQLVYCGALDVEVSGSSAVES